MLKAIVLTLKSGFEIALILSIAISYLRQLNKAYLLRWLIAGAGIAAALGLYAAYHMKQFGGRETFEGYILSVGFVLVALLLLTGVRRMLRKSAASGQCGTRPSRFGWAEKPYALLAAFALTVIPAVDIALFPYNIFIQTFSVVNSELILKFAGGLGGLLLSYLFALAFWKNARKLSSRQLAAGMLTVGVVLLFRQLVTIVQILLATGVLPLNSVTFSVLLPLINLLDKFVYALLCAAVVWVVLFAVTFRSRGEQPEQSNPAILRKLKAALRREWRWLGVVASLVFFIVGLVGTETVLANQTVELSPAVPVTPADGRIRIPVETVNDRNLHRFGFTASDGTIVRFIIVRKSETAYGIGYDACELCGAAGYYQKGNKIICRKCDVVMNIPTIGFPGGCNPIPLAFTMDNGHIEIQAADLEKEKAVFHENSMFHS